MRTSANFSSMRFALLLSLCGFAAVAGDASSPACCIYDPDPRHLWNRVHEALFIRIGADGRTYGLDRLDPLLWINTKHLLEGDAHRRALQVLDEFLDQEGETLIRDPLKRAFLQHDLWALFDWSANPWNHEAYVQEKRALQRRLAAVMQRLALTDSEIASLPDNHARAQVSDILASLPRNLFERDGDWVNVGLEDLAPVAPVHLADFGGRSVFLILLRHPGGRAAAVKYLKQLRTFERPWVYAPPPAPDADGAAVWDPLIANDDLPQFPAGTQWALVRRMCVLDVEGRIQPTSFVESIQVRRYDVVPRSEFGARTAREQQMFEFVATRARGGDLRQIAADEIDFVQFRSMGVDLFEVEPTSIEQRRAGMERMQRRVLGGCPQCHGASGIHSVQSRVRIFSSQTLRPPRLIESEADREWQETLRWKSSQYDFGLLQGLWRGITDQDASGSRGER